MGETCSRLDCSAVEDCTTTLGKKHYVFWYDCAGQPFNKAPGPFVPGSLSSTAGELEQVIVSQEGDVQLTFEHFAIKRSGVQQSAQWRRRYILGRELGAGQTAVVFEAYATSQEEEAGPLQPLPHDSVSPTGKKPGSSDLGRRVALKRLNSAGTSMFRQEVRALLQVGVHPHVLRLLECFCDGEDDVLVLEYCEGGDMYELYAANNGVSMAESFVSLLIRQLLLALDYLTRRGVEHRDVKPENLLLYGPKKDGAAPHLKLADFGWASLSSPGTKPAPVPMEGVGSLWYAPPELNPPVKGADFRKEEAPIGSGDMWSVGIITYLLLVGHSPFNMALRVTDPTARENEVLQLAAHGSVNTNTRAWSRLSTEAKLFITTLIKPQASGRMSADEAWRHKFISSHNPLGTEANIWSPRPPWPSATEKLQVWRCLDGFQRLAWLAIARGVAEPELLEGSVFRHLIISQQMGPVPASYLEQLAMELAGTAVPGWFGANTAWVDVLRIGFRYIDLDADGVLSMADLMRHVVGDEAEKTCGLWLLRWQNSPQTLVGDGQPGLSFADFRMSLWSTLAQRHRVEELRGAAETPDGYAATAAPSPLPLTVPPSKASSEEGPGEEAALQYRMSAIDEVCNQFIESEAFDMDGWN